MSDIETKPKTVKSSVLNRDKTKTKKFDRDIYDQFDSPAKLVVLEYLHKQGLHAIINPDLYGPDIILFRGYTPISYIEVEVKRVWSGPTLQWDTVQLPGRKEKFTRLGLPIEFWILNAEMQHAIIIPDYILDLSLLANVPNRYVQDGEMFYQVPVEKCILKELV